MAGLSLGPRFRRSGLLSSLSLPFAQGDSDEGPQPAVLPAPTALTAQDENFLNGLEQASFQFFWEQTNPETGLIKDRCNARATDTSIVGSIASTGFGLTAICIAHQRGFVSHPDARLRIVRTLSFLWHKLPTHRGFFFHFTNINTGERVWDSEVSSVDTAILLCGVLTCKQHFNHDPEIVELTLICSMWNLSNRFAEALRLVVEPPGKRITFQPADLGEGPAVG